MITRVTEQMRYRMVSENVTRIQVANGTVLEQIASQKRINRPSDDPTGMSKVLDYRATKAAIAQYNSNIDNAANWEKMTETNLEQLNDQIAAARSIGMEYAEDSSIKSALVENVQLIIDAVISVGNAKVGNRYIFSGSMTNTKPFTVVPEPDITHNAGTFDGQSLTGGVFTENADKDYLVDIVTGGALGTATYRISSDAGATWGATSTVPASGTISLTDSLDVDGGLTLTFIADGANQLAATDQFTVNAYTSAAIGNAVAPSGNTYTGTATSGTGPYTGTQNKTYALRITGAGGIGAATYEYSDDGGKTWTAGGAPIAAATTLAEGVSLNFTAGTFAINDIFYVEAKAPGFYNGNGEDLTLDIGQGAGVDMAYNVSGEEVFTDQGKGTVDILANLYSLKYAIQNGDTEGVQTYVNNLKDAQDHVMGIVSTLGVKEDSLANWKNNYTILDNKISDLKSTLEDTDMAKMISDYKMKQTALEAAYTIASQIGKTTILDYMS